MLARVRTRPCVKGWNAAKNGPSRVLALSSFPSSSCSGAVQQGQRVCVRACVCKCERASVCAQARVLSGMQVRTHTTQLTLVQQRPPATDGGRVCERSRVRSGLES